MGLKFIFCIFSFLEWMKWVDLWYMQLCMWSPCFLNILKNSPRLSPKRPPSDRTTRGCDVIISIPKLWFSIKLMNYLTCDKIILIQSLTDIFNTLYITITFYLIRNKSCYLCFMLYNLNACFRLMHSKMQ